MGGQPRIDHGNAIARVVDLFVRLTGATGQCARALGVAHVLEGSVRRAGMRVRITAQLIDASNDQHLWSDVYDRELDDIFAVQEEIANAISAALGDALGVEVAGVAVEASTTSLEAYEQCAIERALAECQGDASIAARRLGIGRSTFYRKLAKHGLTPRRESRTRGEAFARAQ